MTETFSDSLKRLRIELNRRGISRPDAVIVLGSGLGALTDELAGARIWDYGDIPGFPVPAVPGHAGRLAFGRLSGKTVLLLSGRFHIYEGHSSQTAAFPALVAAALGASVFILTNAAGAVNPQWKPGDIMVFEDHIGFLCPNPLIGAPDFVDMSDVYSRGLRRKAFEAAAACGLDLKSGVYFFTTGPSYETPAEVRAAARLGADAVGMSTVPEAVAAASLGLQTAAFSCLTNMAAGITGGKLNHKEVTETAGRQKAVFIRFMKEFIERV